MPAGHIEVVVESVRVHMLSSQHVVILKEVGGDRYLPIWIGPWEANAIAMRLQGVSPERPLTHDLFVSVLAEVGASVRAVHIVDLAAETFHARILLEVPDGTREVDARPSDAIALAVRVGAPVYAAASVMDRAGVRTDETDGADEEKLSVFRDFVNSLDVDAEDERRGGRPPSL
jgi:bifunctional DNase/RNase